MSISLTDLAKIAIGQDMFLWQGPSAYLLDLDTSVHLTLVISLRRFLAADASSCSAASCFSLSSSCFFSAATGSPF